jgi:pimeloyl-ACP methyl ester carboxylesterase
LIKRRNDLNTRHILLFAVFFALFNPAHPQMNLRGWFDAGQTWLVWEDTIPFAETYRIYKDGREISDIPGAEMIGRIFELDGRGFRLRKFNDTLTWIIPDGKGGRYRLKDNEALFVYTPQNEEPAYFAVLRDGNSAVGSQNRVGPVEQVLEDIECHLQVSGLQEDFPYRIYAHWIDGRADHDSGRGDYPVMGNEHCNGTGQVFRIWDYPEGERPERVPMVIALHGGGGWYGRFCPCSDGIYRTYMVNAVVFCPDDGIAIRKPGKIAYQKTYWLGYREGYNRFLMPESQPVPDTGLVINYTMRELTWQIDWLIEYEKIDPERISLMGGSMGARGANYLARAYPEKFAAWLSLSPGIVPQSGDPLVGSAAQNLRTNLPGSPGVVEVMDLHTVLSETEKDIPFGKIVGGRADRSLAALTDEMIQAYNKVNDAGLGCHIYWDDRGHVFTGGSYWSGSYRLTSLALTAYRSDQSFPAFFNDDQDFTSPGRQPELGSGEPAYGDTSGTWGGYYVWDPEKIVDTQGLWKTEVSLNTSGDYPNDIPSFDSSKADMAIRRPQQFVLPEGRGFSWELKRLSDSRVIRSGTGKAGENGLIIIPDLVLFKEKCELSVSVNPEAVFPEDPASGARERLPALGIAPNPFRRTAEVNYLLSRDGTVNLSVYDISGQLVRTLVNHTETAGRHSVAWDAGGLPAGIYICRLKTGRSINRKLCVLSD